MIKKFHVAMFCSEATFTERKEFYSGFFGIPSPDGKFNEGETGRSYIGCKWDREDGLLFVLLKNPDLTGPIEQLGHFGFMFYDSAEFDSEVQRRGISAEKIAVYPAGHKQTFARVENGAEIEWELCFDASQS